MKKCFWISLLICFFSVPTFSQTSQGAFDLLRQGEYKKLIRFCDKNLETIGTEEALYLKGIANYSLEGNGWIFTHGKRMKKALESFTKLLEDHPSDFRYSFRLGLCYFRLYQLDRAQELFDKSLSLCPGNEWSFWYGLYTRRILHSRDSLTTEKTLIRLHDIMYTHNNTDMSQRAQTWGISILSEYKSLHSFDFSLNPKEYYINSFVFPTKFSFDTILSEFNCQTEREKYGWFYWHKSLPADSITPGLDSIPYSRFFTEITLEEIIHLPPDYEIISLSLVEITSKGISEWHFPREKWTQERFKKMLHNHSCYLESIKIRHKSNPNEVIPFYNHVLYFKLHNPNPYNPFSH